MKTIREIKEELQAASGTEREKLLEQHREDSRSGVVSLVKKYDREKELLEKEKHRIEDMKVYENTYSHVGWICGIDEAGRGPLAGPVVAGAVILPEDSKILWLNDSKQLSAKKREELYDVIMEEAISVGVGYASPARIDEINILQATYEAMREAISKLSVQPQILLNDAVTASSDRDPTGADRQRRRKKCFDRSCKYHREGDQDRLMVEYDKIMPEYGFASHKGYGSKSHIEAIQKYGPSPIHRATFIKNFL